MGRQFSARQKAVIWDNDDGQCGICEMRARKKNWEADHVVAWANQGTTTIENGQVSHPWCN